MDLNGLVTAICDARAQRSGVTRKGSHMFTVKTFFVLILSPTGTTASRSDYVIHIWTNVTHRKSNMPH